MSPLAMSLYRIRKTASGWVIRLTDQIDPLNLSSALGEIADAVAQSPPADVELCLDEVSVLQSSAAGQLVDLKRKLDTLGVNLTLTGLQPSVRDVLRCMNLDQVLPIVENGTPVSPSALRPLATLNRPVVVRLSPGFGRASGFQQRIEQHLRATTGPRLILNFDAIADLDDVDLKELVRIVALVESLDGRCAGARMRVSLFSRFQQSDLGGRLMLYPEVGRARVALLATGIDR